jgi:hypothetical protein
MRNYWRVIFVNLPKKNKDGEERWQTVGVALRPYLIELKPVVTPLYTV